jgi:hypothetical protein
VAASLVDALARRDFPAAEVSFDAAMKAALPAALLEAFWEERLASHGALLRVEAYSSQDVQGSAVVRVDLRFEKRKNRLLVTVDASGQIAGLFHAALPEDVEHEARQLVESLARGDAEGASRGFGAKMRAALSPGKVLAAWESLTAQAGPLAAIDQVRQETERGMTTAHVRCRMEKTAVVANVTFDPDGDVVGLRLMPAEADAAWAPPAYVDPSSFEEREVKVGSAPALPGTLALPKGASRVPALVLVHGSGPNDRDETIGPTKVFKDLALGLASRGVAVLRYEKRTRVDPRGVVTQKEEVVDGALAAVALLRATPEVDPARIFVLGHSEGGSVAPRIAEADGKLAGIVVMAGATRPIEDLVLAQLEYLRSLAPGSGQLGPLVEDAKRFKAAVEDSALQPEAEIVVPGGGTISGAYLLDLRGRHPEQTAATLRCPVLVLQGARDYQVTVRDDYEPWRSALGKNTLATFRVYPALDHRFVAGEGPSSPDQYAQGGHVDVHAIDDIGEWVKGSGR